MSAAEGEVLLRPPSWPDLGVEAMTNFDHSIDRTIAEKLIAGDYLAHYPAVGFYGLVWYDKDDATYRCYIERFKKHVTTLSGTLSQIMTEASDAYGWD